MAQNYVQPGMVMDYTNGGSAITSGSVVVVGSKVGVALVDIANGATGAVQFVGVFRLPKNTALAISQGDTLYWDTANSEVTKTATDLPLGDAWSSQALSDEEVDVSLNASAEAGQAENVLALTNNTGEASGASVEALSAVTGVDGSGSNAASKADVDAAFVIVNQNMSAACGKIESALNALKNAGLMAPDA